MAIGCAERRERSVERLARKCCPLWADKWPILNAFGLLFRMSLLTLVGRLRTAIHAFAWWPIRATNRRLRTTCSAKRIVIAPAIGGPAAEPAACKGLVSTERFGSDDVRHASQLVGSRVADLRIDALLAVGGVGAVYEARTDDGASVALKVLLPRHM